MQDTIVWQQGCQGGQASTQCMLQVEEALTAEVRERAPVGVLKRQLVTLQAEVAAAHERLHTTQARLLHSACDTWPWICCMHSGGIL